MNTHNWIMDIHNWIMGSYKRMLKLMHLQQYLRVMWLCISMMEIWICIMKSWISIIPLWTSIIVVNYGYTSWVSIIQLWTSKIESWIPNWIMDIHDWMYNFKIHNWFIYHIIVIWLDCFVGHFMSWWFLPRIWSSVTWHTASLFC